jgi:small subunit ribosomal protein S6
MQRYETIFIIDPDLSEEGRAPVVERLLQLIPQQNGVLVEEDHWGARKLAYPIRKKQRGYYLRLDYCGGGTLVDELERFCRIDDRMLKYMTVKLADEVDVDQVQAEMAERAAAKAAAEAGEPSGDREEDAEEDRSDDENDVDENDDEEDDKE